jgi:hypothetical protein
MPFFNEKDFDWVEPPGHVRGYTQEARKADGGSEDASACDQHRPDTPLAQRVKDMIAGQIDITGDSLGTIATS